jgi:hypothetical protein
MELNEQAAALRLLARLTTTILDLESRLNTLQTHHNDVYHAAPGSIIPTDAQGNPIPEEAK